MEKLDLMVKQLINQYEEKRRMIEEAGGPNTTQSSLLQNRLNEIENFIVMADHAKENPQHEEDIVSNFNKGQKEIIELINQIN